MKLTKFLDGTISPQGTLEDGDIDATFVFTEKEPAETCSVEEFLHEMAYHDFPFIEDTMIPMVIMRKKQRGNTFKTNFKIWTKDQVLDVLYEMVHGRQDLTTQLVEITQENVDYNKEKAGEFSPDYIIMNQLFQKYGKCVLVEDGQQTTTLLQVMIRPILGSHLVHILEEIEFTKPIKFEIPSNEIGKKIVYNFPVDGKDSYKISDWPDFAIKKLTSHDITKIRYKKILYRDIPKIFKNKNKNSSPNDAEVRTVSTGFYSWVASYITATDDELKNDFEEHEKSLPLDLVSEAKRKSEKPFIRMKKLFGKNLGDLFKKHIGENVRMQNEDKFLKSIVCERKRRSSNVSTLVGKVYLDKIVKEKVDKTNKKEAFEEVKYIIKVWKILFKMYATQDERAMKNITRQGFETDLFNFISDILLNIRKFEVSYFFGDQTITKKLPVRLKFNDNYINEVIYAFIEGWNELIQIDDDKKKGKTLTQEEFEKWEVIESTDSFQRTSIEKRTNHWNKLLDKNLDDWLERGVLIPQDINRFFNSKERAAVAHRSNYINKLGEKLDAVLVWNGKEYNTDHFDISWKNGGFTVITNAQVLKAKTNKVKGEKNADEFIAAGV